MNIIITAGGTSEKIDNVRKITNSSSGKLGYTIAKNLIDLYENEINNIYYICSKNSYKPINKKIKLIEIFDTKDLEYQIKELLKNININYFIHSMAVSDYTVDYITTVESLSDKLTYKSKDEIINKIKNHNDILRENKISSNNENLIIKLKKTPKIISMIKKISPSTYLVGFKLMDNVTKKELLETAIKLKNKNNCNLVIANDLTYIRKGLHKAYIIESENNYIVATGKEEISKKLIYKMFEERK